MARRKFIRRRLLRFLYADRFDVVAFGDFVHHIHATENATKDSVLIIQIWFWTKRDIELAACRVWAGAEAGHGYHSRRVVSQLGADFQRHEARLTSAWRDV